MPANFGNWTLRGFPRCLLDTGPEIIATIGQRLITPWYGPLCLQGPLVFEDSQGRVVFCSGVDSVKCFGCFLSSKKRRCAGEGPHGGLQWLSSEILDRIVSFCKERNL